MSVTQMVCHCHPNLRTPGEHTLSMLSLMYSVWPKVSNQHGGNIHRIHWWQHASEDDAGISKHRLSPYNAYYHASDSSSDEICFLEMLIVLQLTQLADSKFQLSITLFENAYFLTFNLNLFLNSLWSCPVLSPSSSWKNNSWLTLLPLSSHRNI